MSIDKTSSGAPSRPLCIALSLSVVWFGVLFLMISAANTANCESGSWYLLYVTCLAPNEIGDLLAGAFAPVAFFWVAAAVFIQAQELRAQREELAASRAAADSQAATANQQLKALLEEARERERERADDDLEQSLKATLARILDSPIPLEFDRGVMGGRGAFTMLSEGHRKLPPERQWSEAAGRLEASIRASQIGEFDLLPCESALSLADELEKELAKSSRLTVGGRIWLESLRIDSTVNSLRIWGEGHSKGTV